MHLRAIQAETRARRAERELSESRSEELAKFTYGRLGLRGLDAPEESSKGCGDLESLFLEWVNPKMPSRWVEHVRVFPHGRECDSVKLDHRYQATLPSEIPVGFDWMIDGGGKLPCGCGGHPGCLLCRAHSPR